MACVSILLNDIEIDSMLFDIDVTSFDIWLANEEAHGGVSSFSIWRC